MSQPEGLGRFIGVTPINVSKEDLDSLRELMKSNKVTYWRKDEKVKKLVGGPCTTCGNIPTKIATYDYNGATIDRTIL